MPGRIPAFVVAGLVVLTGCGPSVSRAYSTSPASSGMIAFTPTSFDLRTAGEVPKPAADAAWSGVLDTLNRYLEAGILTPLRSGGPAGDLRPLFSGPAADRVMAAGPDRFAIIDENLPPVDDLRPRAVLAGLTGLAGPDGIMSVVTAGLDLRLVGTAAGAPISITRTGELVLVPDGGTWRIDAFDVLVTRTLADGATTTTTARS